MSVTYQDYYEILGVNRESTGKEIKTAYRKLAQKWHPDMHSGTDKESAEEKFKQINEAYEVLSDSEKRAKYDRLGANWQDGQGFEPPPGAEGYTFYTGTGAEDGGFSDFFEMLFGRGGHFTRSSGKVSYEGMARGSDAEAEIEITLEEAYHGTEKKLQMGTGEILTVKVPAGVCSGNWIRLKGQGRVALQGGFRGDLYLKVNIAPHKLYLRGKGLPKKNGRGDEYVRLKIDIPAQLTEEEQQLYRKLAAISGVISVGR